MDTRANTLTLPSETPPALRGRRRFYARALSWVGFAGGGTLLVGYLSLIVLIPIAAVVSHGFGFSIHTHGAGAAFWNWSFQADFSGFWDDVTNSVALQAIWLSVWLSLAVATLNSVMGVAIAWVLVRDDFKGKWFIEGLIDLPFALPTIVAGLVLLFLYGDASPLGINLFETYAGLLIALLFVTLPFSVRAVQPVLQSLDGHAEDAARTLGAGNIRVFRTVVLPSLWPTVLSGFGLGFARAIGEFGAITFISGGLARTTPASALIFNLTQEFGYDDAAAVSTALLCLSLLILVSCGVFSRRVQQRLSG